MTQRKRIAAIITEYRLHSHADVIIGRILNGYWFDGHREPRLELVSMYTDQVPDNDMSRDMAARYGFKIVPSVRQALTGLSDQSRGPRELAVDGVVFIGEHGNYPYNALGQKMYPRHRLFKQIVDVFRETGQSCPVFHDKHYSYDWHQARWMVDQAHALGFPMLAGSVCPLSRPPSQFWPTGRSMSKAMWAWQADFIGNKDSYGFHAIEELQGMVGRRSGGETGIRAVQCLEGAPVWTWTDANPWAERLLEAVAPGMAREAIADPMVFRFEYNDGLEAAIYRINGYPTDERFAALTPNDEVVMIPRYGDAPPAYVPPDDLRDRYPIADWFNAEVAAIEDLIIDGRLAHPPERTLLTSGALAALHESSYEPRQPYGLTYQHGRHLEEGRIIDTPHLAISY